MQVNMENNSNHFLSASLELQTYEEKVDLNNILAEHAAGNLVTPPRTPGGKSSVECPVCFVKFTQKNNLSRHMQRFHGVKPPRSCLPSKVDPSLPECSECNMKFTRKSNLFRHMKKFHGFLAPFKIPELPKVFSCTECDHKFTQWKNCLRHMRNIHSVRDSIKEEVDQPSLKSESNPALEDNMEYVIEVDPFPVISPLRMETIPLEHTDSLESVSPCENQLPESNSNHEDGSTPQKNSKVICAACGVWFSTPFNLRRHTKRFHEGKEDIFEVSEAVRSVKPPTRKETPPSDFSDHKLLLRTCRECQVTFSSPFNLRRHIQRVHSELHSAAAAIDSTCRKKSEKRFFCPVCNVSSVSFSTPFNLRRHMKRIHPESELETSVSASLAAAQPPRKTCAIDSDKNRLLCPLCPEGSVSFSTPSNLRRHLRKFHQSEEDSVIEVEEPMIDTTEIMKCPRCDYRENRLNLYVHFNLVHGLQVVIEYQVFDSETQLDEWLSQISPEAQFVVRKSDSNRMVISCSHPSREDEFCPAEMMILTESDKCTVHYVKTHVHES